MLISEMEMVLRLFIQCSVGMVRVLVAFGADVTAEKWDSPTEFPVPRI
jgi:hypothetical protein